MLVSEVKCSQVTQRTSSTFYGGHGEWGPGGFGRLLEPITNLRSLWTLSTPALSDHRLVQATGPAFPVMADATSATT